MLGWWPKGMRAALGQPVVIENVTGVGLHRHGSDRPRRARRLQHSLRRQRHACADPAVLNLNYDLVTDFEPIALIGNTPWLIAAKNDLPANDLRELSPG